MAPPPASRESGACVWRRCCASCRASWESPETPCFPCVQAVLLHIPVLPATVAGARPFSESSSGELEGKAGPPVYQSGRAWGEQAAGDTSEQGPSWPWVLKPTASPVPRAPPLGQGGGKVGREGWSWGWAEPSTIWGMQAPRAARLLQLQKQSAVL